MLRTTCTIVHFVLRIIAHPPCATCVRARTRPPRTPHAPPPHTHPHTPAHAPARRRVELHNVGVFGTHTRPLRGSVRSVIRPHARPVSDPVTQTLPFVCTGPFGACFAAVRMMPRRMPIARPRTPIPARFCGWWCHGGGDGADAVGEALAGSRRGQPPIRPCPLSPVAAAARNRFRTAPLPRCSSAVAGAGKIPLGKAVAHLRLPPAPAGGRHPPREGSTPLPPIRRGRGGPPIPLLKNGGGRRKKIDLKTGSGDVNVYIFAGGWGVSVYDGKARGKGL